MDPSLQRSDPPPHHAMPLPWWMPLTLLLASLFLFPLVASFLAGDLFVPAREHRLGLWRPAYGLTYSKAMPSAYTRDDTSQSTQTRLQDYPFLVRALRGIEGAMVLFTAGGLGVAWWRRGRHQRLARWWTQDSLTRVLAWTLALTPWGYLALYSAMGLGYAYILEYALALQLQQANVRLQDPWAILAVGALVVGGLVGVELYRMLNGVPLRVVAVLGADELIETGDMGWKHLPKLRGKG